MNNNTYDSKEKNIIKTDILLKEEIIGTRTLTNYTFSLITFLGSISFLVVGISTYLKFNLIPFLDSSQIIFFPQGLVMSLYGIGGILISLYQFLIIYWKIGEGYNEFDKQKNTMTIFRRGFPGKNSEIKITCPLTDIVRIFNFMKIKNLKYINK